MATALASNPQTLDAAIADALAMSAVGLTHYVMWLGGEWHVGTFEDWCALEQEGATLVWMPGEEDGQ